MNQVVEAGNFGTGDKKGINRRLFLAAGAAAGLQALSSLEASAQTRREENPPESYRINVAPHVLAIKQEQLLTCESAGVRKALAHHGVYVPESVILNAIGSHENPNKGQRGFTNRQRNKIDDYGVHAPRVKEVVDTWPSEQGTFTAHPIERDRFRSNPYELLQELKRAIAQNQIVMAWVTLGLAPSSVVPIRLSNGEWVEIAPQEHQFNLIGYNRDGFVVDDTWGKAQSRSFAANRELLRSLSLFQIPALAVEFTPKKATEVVKTVSLKEVSEEPLDFDIENGHFYMQASPVPKKGFSIIDHPLSQRWTFYQRLGRETTMGYPISAFSGSLTDENPNLYQLFQNGVLQHDLAVNKLRLATVSDLFSKTEKDEWLFTEKGIPYPIPLEEEEREQQIAARTELLTNESIKERYLTDPANPKSSLSFEEAADLYGLPMSMPEQVAEHFPFTAQRFQNVVLQEWTENIPDIAAKGVVTFAPVGEFAKEANILVGINYGPEDSPRRA